MRYRIEDDVRVFHLDLNSGVSAAKALEKALDVIKIRPDLWGWDWIVQARITPADASFEQIGRLARVFYTPPEDEVLSVLVSHDGSLPLWARVMDFQFPRRRHVVVATLEEAHERIRKHRMART